MLYNEAGQRRGNQGLLLAVLQTLQKTGTPMRFGALHTRLPMPNRSPLASALATLTNLEYTTIKRMGAKGSAAQYALTAAGRQVPLAEVTQEGNDE